MTLLLRHDCQMAAILDFWIIPKTSEKRQNWTKRNQNQQRNINMNYKRGKYNEKSNILHFKKEF